MLVILLAGGMGAAAVGTHSIDKTTYKLFLLPAVAPLIIRCFMEQTDVHVTIALMLCFLVLIMVRAANQTRQILIDNINMTESLRYRATHDGLVDLLNREEFQKEFDEITASPAPPIGNSVISIIFIDLDNFKTLNDTLGHLAGDKALVKIGEIIRSSIRKTDIAARFGGDEFMILIQSDSVEQAKSVADKILNEIDQVQEDLQQKAIPLTASIGIGYGSHETVSFNKLLSAADKACYQAKNTGKGKTCLRELSQGSAHDLMRRKLQYGQP